MHHCVCSTPTDAVEVPHNSSLPHVKYVCLLSTQQFQALLTFFSKSFSFSLKVLVHYQSQAYIHIWMALTTHFALHSQKAWFSTCMQYTKINKWQTGMSPLLLLCSKKHPFNPPLEMQFYTTCQGFKPHLSDWTNSNSFAITSDIQFGVNSSAYLYA